ncbi:Flagellar biosynthetic protein FlhB [bacterium HR29]|jgi:flagellar biosynthetic protein FlhB|nr:Flagellar biosynthetic protein FlhB [bacterium HR29]
MAGERTEAPTPRRLRDARRRGDVAKSQEVASVGVLLIAALALRFLGGTMAGELGAVMREWFAREPAALTLDSAAGMGRAAGLETMRILAPLLGLLLVGGVTGHVVQSGFLVTGAKLRPRLSAIDPVKGTRRLLSLDALVNLGKSVLKLAIVAGVVALTLRSRADDVIALGALPVGAAAARVAELIFDVLIRATLALFVLTVADYAWQWWMHRRALRMSKQDIREELKETEGNPEIKAAFRRRRHQLLNRMIAAVPKADVVVTNPVHYAVALKYDPISMQAPVVVAKGERLLAQRIKEVARKAGVPVVEEPALARALFKAVPVGKPIPVSLYRAVAEVLAWVYAVRERAANRWRPAGEAAR